MKRLFNRRRATVIALSVYLVSGCASPHRPQNAPKSVAVVEPAAGATGQSASGRAAITPSFNSQITESQLRSYVMARAVPRTLSTEHVAVHSIAFMSSRRVSRLLQSAPLAVPGREPMWLVIMTGRFVFAGPEGATPAFPVAVEVFDAKTGSLLQSGGLPKLPNAVRNPGVEPQ